MNKSALTTTAMINTDVSNMASTRPPSDPGRLSVAVALVAAAILIAAIQWIATLFAQVEDIAPDQTAQESLYGPIL